MHANTDSEASYVSSPPRRQAYYVQSPSHESTPAHSPAGSPPHSASLGRHSRESSTSRYSGSIKPGGSGKINPNQAERGEMWREEGIIKEEEAGLLEEEVDEMEERKGLPRRCYVLGFMLAFLVLFFFFALILWGASHNKHPIISMDSITFHNFVIQAGTDASLVPTELSTLNSTVKLSYRNTGTFFGVHVSSTPLVVYYSQVVLATGNINKFYQSRKSQRSLTVLVGGNAVPLYGGGSSLSSTPGKAGYNVPIPLTLNFTIRSRAYVLGKLVKPKFYSIVQCSLNLDQTKLGTKVSLKNSCRYGN
ncbi:hypothetical protein LUZ62_026693 [Rhynchospora pubera]|uniref:Late embryogenesis abundant protein LEA-2 subgroup domain-containing protein n=1 Tax=Rhynchospora pubera TaxID=906938 RepID=A0AAV8HH43_9POAL|nr:hypothetical protein LUZ62_026693 [Rhynchospora pubera]